MKHYSVFLALTLAIIPFVGKTAEGPLTATSNFFDFMKTNPANGEPLLLRNGRWVSVETRLGFLRILADDIALSAYTAEHGIYSDETKAMNSIALTNKVQEAGIPAGLFTGKYYPKIADIKLRQVMELEKALGEGRAMEFKGPKMAEWMHGEVFYWSKYKPARGSTQVVARESKVIGNLKKAGTIARRSVLPAIIVGAVAYQVGVHAGHPAESVKGETPSPALNNDEAFGAD